MTDDCTWWIAGKPSVIPAAGTRSKEETARLFHAMIKQTKAGLQLSVHSAVAEGDRVALEAASHAELKNGHVYEQEYHVLMVMRGGKICAVREYLDTQHVLATWFAP